MKTQTIKFIRGSTFSYTGLIKLPAGLWTVSGDIKIKEGSLVSEMVCTLVPLSVPDASGNTHSILLEVDSTVTTNWPINTLIADLYFSDDSVPTVVLISSTFSIAVQDSVTAP